jgi:hypothetical protein
MMASRPRPFTPEAIILVPDPHNAHWFKDKACG